MARFDGKCAIVTGAGSGIGEAIARQLAAEGAAVLVADLDAAKAEAVANDIGGKAHTCDMADPDAVKAMVKAATDWQGALHVLINNAGIGASQTPVGDYPLDEWHHVITVNLNGVFYGMRYALPALVAAGGGAIVNVSSILGSVGFPAAAPYVAAKHGVVGLTKTAALDYAKQNVRVTAVGPGFIETPLLSGLPQEMLDGLASMHPVGRIGQPAEVATLVAFLASDEAAFITGSYHLVDGGYTAQ